MKATEFELKMSNVSIPSFVRAEAQKAIGKLRVDADGHIEVSDKTFWLICKHAGLTPIDGRCYRFVRIFDDLDNSVDIQTRRIFIEPLVNPIFSTYPNPIGNI